MKNEKKTMCCTNQYHYMDTYDCMDLFYDRWLGSFFSIQRCLGNQLCVDLSIFHVFILLVEILIYQNLNFLLRCMVEIKLNLNYQCVYYTLLDSIVKYKTFIFY